MQKWIAGLLAATSLLALATPASAKRIAAPPPIPERFALADCVVIGKVTEIENKSVKTKDGQEYLVAVVKVEEMVLGDKGLTHVKVGFVPVNTPRFGFNLKEGQEVGLFLGQHPQETFHVITGFMTTVPKENTAEIDMMKRCGKLLKDPIAGLKSKDAEDRLLTATMQVARYRTPRENANKQEAIDAEESKLLLQTLADADWTKVDPNLRQTPLNLFFRLGITEKDGWKQPANPTQLQEEAKKWLKANAGTYRVQRFVSDKK
jgi:hypothetical protein